MRNEVPDPLRQPLVQDGGNRLGAGQGPLRDRTDEFSLSVTAAGVTTRVTNDPTGR